jgi:hypothetical protein
MQKKEMFEGNKSKKQQIQELLITDIETQASSNASKNSQTLKPDESNPCLGFTWAIISVLCFASSDSLAKIIYLRYPQIQVFEVLFLRFAMALPFFVIILNKNMKKVMWDNIPGRLFPALLVRVL